MKPETKEWLDLADMDTRGADVLLAQGLWPLAVFHAHQIVEKTLKAVWVEQHSQGVPPRTHDLLELVSATGIDLPEWREFLARLSRQSVETRYGSAAGYAEADAREYVQKAEEVCAVLRQTLS